MFNFIPIQNKGNGWMESLDLNKEEDIVWWTGYFPHVWSVQLQEFEEKFILHNERAYNTKVGIIAYIHFCNVARMIRIE